MGGNEPNRLDETTRHNKDDSSLATNDSSVMSLLSFLWRFGWDNSEMTFSTREVFYEVFVAPAGS